MQLFFNSRVIALAMLASLAPFAIDTYLPAFHIIADDFLTSPEFIQQSLTFYLVPYTVMTLFHGAISDSIGRIKTIQWGLALFFVASIGCALSTSVESLWFFRVLQGIGGGAGNVVARAMVRDLYEGPQAQRVMATIQIIFGIAPAIAPMIGGLLLGFDWHAIFIFLALYAAMMIIMSSYVLPETMPINNRLPFSFANVKDRYKSLISNKEFLLLIVAISANFSAFFIYVLASPVFLMDHLGFTFQQFGYLFIPTVIGMMIGSFVAKRAAGSISPTKLLRVGYYWMTLIVSSNLLFCSFFANEATINIGFIALYNIGMAAVMPVISIAALDQFPKMRGTAASGQAFSQMFFASIVAGLIVPVLWFSTFGLSLGLFLIFFIGLLTITKTKLWNN
jgi:DHA1 family bicyclomycin/chloramphenicol resistance-like MFS transporter|tara:strand:+ start:7558 stop:8736 length:1179 start_codon:yes stop_codon:yes gene_type:complete